MYYLYLSVVEWSHSDVPQFIWHVQLQTLCSSRNPVLIAQDTQTSLSFVFQFVSSNIHVTLKAWLQHYRHATLLHF